MMAPMRSQPALVLSSPAHRMVRVIVIVLEVKMTTVRIHEMVTKVLDPGHHNGSEDQDDNRQDTQDDHEGQGHCDNC